MAERREEHRDRVPAASEASKVSNYLHSMIGRRGKTQPMPQATIDAAKNLARMVSRRGSKEEEEGGASSAAQASGPAAESPAPPADFGGV